MSHSSLKMRMELKRSGKSTKFGAQTSSAWSLGFLVLLAHFLNQLILLIIVVISTTDPKAPIQWKTHNLVCEIYKVFVMVLVVSYVRGYKAYKFYDLKDIVSRWELVDLVKMNVKWENYIFISHIRVFEHQFELHAKKWLLKLEFGSPTSDRRRREMDQLAFLLGEQTMMSERKGNPDYSKELPIVLRTRDSSITNTTEKPSCEKVAQLEKRVFAQYLANPNQSRLLAPFSRIGNLSIVLLIIAQVFPAFRFRLLYSNASG
jgi:hypothetical protein